MPRLFPLPCHRSLVAAAMLLFAAALAVWTPQATASTAEAPRIEELEGLGRGRPLESAAELETLLSRTEPFSALRLEALTVRGQLLSMRGQGHAAEGVAADLDSWARARRSPEAAAAALFVRSRAVSQTGALKRADRLGADALARLPADASATMRFRLLLAASSVKGDLGLLEEAVRLGQEAQRVADTLGTPWRRVTARTTLAYVYFNARQFERARELNEEALAIAAQAQDDLGLARAYNVASIILQGFNDPAGELRTTQLAIEHARRAQAKADEALYLANLADYYLKDGDYKTALALAEQALPLTRELKDATGESVALANIGLAHISLQRIDLGKRYLAEAITLDERRGALTGVAMFQADLGKSLERAGDLPGAIGAYHRHRSVADEILQRDQQEAILALQEQFDADRRTREFTLLNRENQLKAEQLRRVELQQRLWWLLAGVALLSIAVVALMSRRVRETNLALASSNDLLKRQSERDPLTGLANRRSFQGAMAQRSQDGAFTGTLYLIDIDHFKRINDSHGHAAGDAVLLEVAQRLSDTLRGQDMVVRWGGEEFLVVVRALSPEPVDGLAQRLLAALDAVPVVHDGRHIPITASIGYASFPMAPAQVPVSWERAVNLVDTAMYLAKAHGRNRAYGVRRMHVHDEAGFERVTRSLEAAWREGQVELVVHQGTSTLEVAA